MSGSAPLSDEGTTDVEAYHLYLQGHFAFLQRTGDELQKSIGFFKDAIARDPKFARAYTGLAQVYWVLPDYAEASSEDSHAQAERYARLAIQLDDKSAGAYAVLGLLEIFANRWQESVASLAKAVALNPRDTTTRLWYAQTLLMAGLATRGESELAQTISLDPGSGINRNWHALALDALGRSADAQAEAQRAIDLGHFQPSELLAEAAFRRGDWKAAADYVIRSVNFDGLPPSERALARLCAERLLGDPARLPELEKALDANFKTQKPIVNYVVVLALMRVGKFDQAVSFFGDPSLANSDVDMMWAWRPIGTPVRRSAAFKAWARRSGIVDLWRSAGWADACHPVGADDFECQ